MALSASQIKRALRKVEAESATGGTGATILRMAHNTIGKLAAENNAAAFVDGQKFGSHELQAAEEIGAAVFAIAGGSMFKPISLERLDRGNAVDISADLAFKIRRYQAWAGFWSKRAKRGDPTLQIVYGAVVDEWPIRTIAEDIGHHHSKVKAAVVRGLRDYAVRAGWISGGLARQWSDLACKTFPR